MTDKCCYQDCSNPTTDGGVCCVAHKDPQYRRKDGRAAPTISEMQRAILSWRAPKTKAFDNQLTIDNPFTGNDTGSGLPAGSNASAMPPDQATDRTNE